VLLTYALEKSLMENANGKTSRQENITFKENQSGKITDLVWHCPKTMGYIRETDYLRKVANTIRNAYRKIYLKNL